LSELSRALEVLEGEALLARGGASPTASTASSAAAAAAAWGGPAGASPDASVAGGAAAFANGMVKLYNDLALRLLDARDYDQALSMLRKAEALLDADATWAWAPPGAGAGAERAADGGAADDGDGGAGGGLGRLAVGGTSADEVAAGAAGVAGDGAAAVALGPAELLAGKRQRLRAITLNNLGCLHKRRGAPQQALAPLHRALALEEAGGQVHNCASTHLNICAALSALRRGKEALAHAERAILLLQRLLWGPTASTFQDGMAHAGRTLAALGAAAAAAAAAAGAGAGAAPPEAPPPPAQRQQQQRHRQLTAAASVLAMAYHNAAVEHEKLGRGREAGVSHARACAIGAKFLGARAPTTAALGKAQKAFLARQTRASSAPAHAAAPSAGAARKGGAAGGRAAAAAGASVKVRQTDAKRPNLLGRETSRAGAGTGGARGKLGAAGAGGSKATLPLDKAARAGSGARSASAAKLSERSGR
jgi:tetratricopeptide (TPR) repeat protein